MASVIILIDPSSRLNRVTLKSRCVILHFAEYYRSKKSGAVKQSTAFRNVHEEVLEASEERVMTESELISNYLLYKAESQSPCREEYGYDTNSDYQEIELEMHRQLRGDTKYQPGDVTGSHYIRY